MPYHANIIDYGKETIINILSMLRIADADCGDGLRDLRCKNRRRFQYNRIRQAKSGGSEVPGTIPLSGIQYKNHGTNQLNGLRSDTFAIRQADSKLRVTQENGCPEKSYSGKLKNWQNYSRRSEKETRKTLGREKWKMKHPNKN
jgi:hypothetical protein